MGRTKNYETGNEKINDRFVPKIYRYASKGETAKKLDYSRLYYGHICLGNRLILEHIYKDCSNFLDPECGINQDPAFNWFYSDIVRNVNNFIAAHDLENDIISKELLYRTVIKCARDNYVLKSKHNSASCNMNTVYLCLYLHIYLYALIYPNIFADVKLNDMNNNNQSSFLKEHIREIYLAEYLLERAIIFDGFLSVINHNFIEIINNEDSYSINDFLSEKENLNDGKIHELYSANVEFIGKFYHSKYPQKKLSKTKKVLLNHNFFSSLHKGEKNYNAIIANLKSLKESYDSYLNDPKHTNMEKLFSLYHLNKLTHIFDFQYHNDFGNIDFHLTEGFATNFVLHYIMSKNKAFLDNGFFDYLKNSKKEAMEDNGISISSVCYTCNCASDLSIKDNLSVADLSLIRNLIKKVANTLNSYTLRIDKRQLSSLLFALNVTKNDLTTLILNNIEIPLQLDHKEKKYGNYGLKYYKTIYNDLYSQNNLFSSRMIKTFEFAE